MRQEWWAPRTTNRPSVVVRSPSPGAVAAPASGRCRPGCRAMEIRATAPWSDAARRSPPRGEHRLRVPRKDCRPHASRSREGRDGLDAGRSVRQPDGPRDPPGTARRLSPSMRASRSASSSNPSCDVGFLSRTTNVAPFALRVDGTRPLPSATTTWTTTRRTFAAMHGRDADSCPGALLERGERRRTGGTVALERRTASRRCADGLPVSERNCACERRLTRTSPTVMEMSSMRGVHLESPERGT